MSVTIDNSKKSSTSGKWSNPGTKLYTPIIDQKGAINEAYLVVESGYKDAPSEKLKYPHHVIKGNKLIVHKDGVQAAFSRAKQIGLIGKPITHIKKHYKELGLDMSNFSIWDEEISNLWEKKDFSLSDIADLKDTLEEQLNENDIDEIMIENIRSSFESQLNKKFAQKPRWHVSVRIYKDDTGAIIVEIKIWYA
jgi:hypothetical protein